MEESITKRENTKVLELAREYKKKGFRVITRPGRSELPAFMENMDFQPDLIAMSDKENLVIEVKSSDSVRNVKTLASHVDVIKEKKGWDFIFVMTNPKTAKESVSNIQSPKAQDVFNYLDKAQELLESDQASEYKDAALLLAWAGAEAAMRYMISNVYNKKMQSSSSNLLRDSVMYGVISRADDRLLNSLLSVRNKISHGYSVKNLDDEKIWKLIFIANRIIEESNEIKEINTSTRKNPQKNEQ